MSLWHCYANGAFGRFGDYILATSADDARQKFRLIYRIWPTQVQIERRAK